jgi:hypothetical protein
MSSKIKMVGIIAFLFFLIKGLFWLGLVVMTYSYMP